MSFLNFQNTFLIVKSKSKVMINYVPKVDNIWVGLLDQGCDIFISSPRGQNKIISTLDEMLRDCAYNTNL